MSAWEIIVRVVIVVLVVGVIVGVLAYQDWPEWHEDDE